MSTPNQMTVAELKERADLAVQLQAGIEAFKAFDATKCCTSCPHGLTQEQYVEALTIGVKVLCEGAEIKLKELLTVGG